MKKPADLRAHLERSVACLRAEPDKLAVYVERGVIASRLGGGMSFEYRYDLVLVIENYSDHADTLMIPLLAWISVNQSELMQNPDTIPQAIKFEAELIDHDTADIEITLALTEAVAVSENDGIYTATHIAPPPLDDLTGPTGWTLQAGDVEVAP